MSHSEEVEDEWFVEGTLVPSEKRIAQLLKRKSLFIVATNELNMEVLSAEEMLEGYKRQVHERGFLPQGSSVSCRLALYAKQAAHYGVILGLDAVPAGLLCA